MNNKEIFIKEIERLLETNPIDQAALDFFIDFKSKKTSSPITEKGVQILSFLKNFPDQSFSSKQIGEEIKLTSRSVAGAARKLIEDGLIEKTDSNPSKYKITSQGIKFNLNDM